MRREILAISLAIAIITLITSNQLSIYASPTTEDDGWTEGDYEGSPEEQEEQAHDDWEDAGKPGDDNNDNDNGDNDNNDLPRCELGVVVDCIFNDLGQTCEVGSSEDACQDIYGGVQGSPERDQNGQLINKPNPYCDQVDNPKDCWDRRDYDQATGLYPCNDGTQKTDWRDCKDATKKNNDNDGPDKTTTASVPQTQSKVLSVRTCGQIGFQDGDSSMFHLDVYKTCGDSYTDAFINGCEQSYKELGFVFVACDRIVAANID